ncbi:hypothetical protein ACWU4D_00225 [Vibrio sp. WJH972]
MSDDFNKPKNIAQVGESFEDHLRRMGKMSKQATSDRYPVQQRKSSFPSSGSNTPVSSTNTSLSTKAKESLSQYKESGQHIQILKVWGMLMQAFDSKLRHFFGDEPDVHFMKFAASLTPESYKRLEANLLERLDEDREWPPSLIRLRQLANSPTKETMYKARQNLFHYPVPISELTRVELYIKRFKMHEVRRLSDRYFETEFNRKYTLWFREVMLEDMDIKIAAKQSEIDVALDTQHVTENDRIIDESIAKGDAFNHKFGQRISDVLKEKASLSIEEITPLDAVELEQQNLAEKIRKDFGNH